MKIVLDSDVVIAGLISPKGAGRYLLKKALKIKKISLGSSKNQIQEIEQVIKNKNFSSKINISLLKRFKENAFKVKLSPKVLRQTLEYVNDPNDNHILSLVVAFKAKFLLTYNIKDYKINKIKSKFDILVKNPGYFIQYLRLIGLN